MYGRPRLLDGRIVATVGDALEPITREGRFAGFTAGGADWARAVAERPEARAAGEAPQGGSLAAGYATEKWTLRRIGASIEREFEVRLAPKFGEADAAADGLELAAPNEPSPATESGGYAVEADAGATLKKALRGKDE